MNIKLKYVKILKGLASENRCRILEYISKGIEHPDDIASKIKATRQAVDKQLGVLYELGLIKKEAITPPSGRPKVIFKITSQGNTLMLNIDNVLHRFLAEVEKELRHEIENLDNQLLKGEISEEIYHKRNTEVRKRYSSVTQETLGF